MKLTLQETIIASLCVLLCSDRTIRRINRQWLDRDRSTNVIAFPSVLMSEITRARGPLRPIRGALDDHLRSSDPMPHLGDIALGVETARREGPDDASDQRVAYLALHGLLHILGWDHEDETAWRRMDAETRRLLSIATRQE